jgi:hypothetical protein
MGRRPSRGWAEDLETAGMDAPAEPTTAWADVAWPPWLEGLFTNHLKHAVVTDGMFQGDRARLQIRGTDSDDRKVRGTIELRKVGGSWRVTAEALFFDQ